MNKKIGITRVIDLVELIIKVNDFADNITSGDIDDLPHLNNALEEWKQTNFSFLTAQQFSDFIKVKKRIENLISEFQITTL